jgi:hypothetical protein
MSGSVMIPDDRPALDIVDAAFMRRLASPAREDRREAAPLPPDPQPVAPAPRAADVVTAEPPGARNADGSVVDWMLRAVPEQWNVLAAAVERAADAGQRVIAVVGGSRGEGRTTIVEGLATTLTRRGRSVLHTAVAPAHDGAVRNPHDDGRIMLVDAGVWFPPGPIRHDRVARLAAGCDAAILVRRAAQSPSPARAAAIRRAGLVVLGEVETLVPAETLVPPLQDSTA